MWQRAPGLFGLPTTREEATLCIFGAPFDGTSSGHAGSRFAPQAIREASDFLETYSPIQDKDITALQAIDVGDLRSSIGNTTRALQDIHASVSAILQRGQRPVMLGGEHLCTLPAVEATLTQHPELCVLQLDAHTDLRDTYLGESLSHATVMRRVVERLASPQDLITYGVRSGLKEEFQFAKKCRVCGPPDGIAHHRISALRHHLAAIQGRPLYLTIDLDVFDPGIFPGTGTPEPGGIFFDEFVQILPYLREQNIVALDLVELCPPAAHGNVSAVFAAKVLRELLLLTL